MIFFDWLESKGDELEVDDDDMVASRAIKKDNDSLQNKALSNEIKSETDINPVRKKRKRRNIFASSLRSSFSLCNSSKKKKTKHSNEDKGMLNFHGWFQNIRSYISDKIYRFVIFWLIAPQRRNKDLYLINAFQSVWIYFVSLSFMYIVHISTY